MSREALKSAQRFVFKVGSSLLTSADLSLNRAFITSLGTQLKHLRERCDDIVLVTSGAVTAGLPLLGWRERPVTFTDMHVAAAVGQISLFRAYDEIFSPLGFRLAQVLLTAEELAHRTTYINARSTLRRLLDLDLMPLVNENDAIAISERRFGDNDRLAAELANLLEAQVLVILTDVDGIYIDGSPKSVLTESEASNPQLLEHIRDQAGSRYGSGGMTSKLEAATRAANSGTHTIIANGRQADILTAIVAGEPVGTLLTAPRSRMSAKERWLATCAQAKGSVLLDQGAVAAVIEQGRSLLPIGVVGIEGQFRRGDVVGFKDPDGVIIAQGMINYDSREMVALIRKHSKEIHKILGYVVAEEVVHRDNMVSFAK